MADEVGLVVGKGTQFCDGNGVPLAGGSLQVLTAAGDPATLYTDSSATTVVAATQGLDASGRLAVSLWGVGNFLVQELDSSGGLVATLGTQTPKGPTGATGPQGATGPSGSSVAGVWVPALNGDVPAEIMTDSTGYAVLVQAY